VKLLVISSPFEYTGGQKRNKLALKEYAKNGLSVDVIVPYSGLKYYNDYRRSIKEVNNISDGVRGVGYLYIRGKPKFSFDFLPEINTLYTIENFRSDYDLVLGMHENFDTLYWSMKFSEMYNTRSAILLYNPPFYSKKKRKTLVQVYSTYKDLIPESEFFTLVKLNFNKIMLYLYEMRAKKLLRKFYKVIAASKATILDMGYTPDARFAVFDNPGVPSEELRLLKKIKLRTFNKCKEKKYILYSGGYDLNKGIFDALLAFSIIKKNFSEKVKLVVTGKENKIAAVVKRLSKRLNIENDIVLTGMISKEEFFELKSQASLTIHPSHLDSFSYNVFESLVLGTPVVGYNISAMEIYYKRLSGVVLVNELDWDALACEAINILENPPEVIESPKILTWNSVISAEINLLKTLGDV